MTEEDSNLKDNIKEIDLNEPEETASSVIPESIEEVKISPIEADLLKSIKEPDKDKERRYEVERQNRFVESLIKGKKRSYTWMIKNYINIPALITNYLLKIIPKGGFFSTPTHYLKKYSLLLGIPTLITINILNYILFSIGIISSILFEIGIIISPFVSFSIILYYPIIRSSSRK